MSKILVTGGAGMIGSNLVKRLIKEQHYVIVVDNLWRGRLEYLDDDFGNAVIDIHKQFYKRDLSLPNMCEDLLDGVDYVIHLADIVAGIGYVFLNQGAIFRQNILINSNVIDSVKRSKIKGFMYIGTACSFPKTLQNSYEFSPLREEDLYPAQPESAYGWSKLMGQYETELIEIESDIETCSLMLHNVYGPQCDFSKDKSQVIPSLIRKAINYPKEDFIVWGSGKQGRAFIYVDDVINGILLALEGGWGSGHIQLGPSECTSIKTIADTIINISGKRIEGVYDTSKPEGDKSRSANYSKAKKVLGWEPITNLESGIRQQYAWIKNQIERGI